MPVVDIAKELNKGYKSEYDIVDFSTSNSANWAPVVLSPFTDTDYSAQGAPRTKYGSMCLGHPEEWTYSAGHVATPLPLPPERYPNPADGTYINYGASGIIGVDTGLDPMVDNILVKTIFYEASWSDFWTQCGPYVALDPTGTHNTDMGWGFLRDQTVGQFGVSYMIEVFGIPKEHWLDPDEYQNTFNFVPTEIDGNSDYLSSSAGNEPPRGIQLEVETNGDGTITSRFEGNLINDSVPLPAAYATGATGICGATVIEIQVGPGFRDVDYGLDFSDPNFLTFGWGPLSSGIEFPGVTFDCIVEW